MCIEIIHLMKEKHKQLVGKSNQNQKKQSPMEPQKKEIFSLTDHFSNTDRKQTGPSDDEKSPAEQKIRIIRHDKV